MKKLAAIVLAVTTSACIVQSSPPPPYRGSVVFDWTVDGTTNPSLCDATGADSFSVAIYDDRDRPVGTYDAPCASFATSISLGEGRYSADAVLIDGSGRARTTTVHVIPFTVIGGTSLDVPLDFPANAFY